jgi:uncharacterized protein YdiU (UPF0061 family)
MEIETRHEILEAVRVLAGRPLNNYDVEALLNHYLPQNYPRVEGEKEEQKLIDWFVVEDRKELIVAWAVIGFIGTLLLKYLF